MNKTHCQTTFVIPCYNHARFLHQSLGGILNQKNRPAKIIFIDDASTDGSHEIASRLLAGKTQTQIISHSENRGVIYSLNEGLALVDTPFVAFAAADDHLYSNFLEISENALQNVPEAALVTSRSDIISPEGCFVGHRPAFPPAFQSKYISPQSVKELLGECDNFLLGNVALYRVRHLREIHGFDANLKAFCDGMVMRSLALKFGFVYLRETLGSWRSHSSNYSKSSMYSCHYAEDMVDHVRQFIVRENLSGYFPENYETVLLARLKFGLARTLLENCEYDIRGQHFENSMNQALGSLSYYKLLSKLPSKRMRWLFSHLFLYYKYKPYQNKALLRLGRNSLERNFRMMFNFRKRFSS